MLIKLLKKINKKYKFMCKRIKKLLILRFNKKMKIYGNNIMRNPKMKI